MNKKNPMKDILSQSMEARIEQYRSQVERVQSFIKREPEYAQKQRIARQVGIDQGIEDLEIIFNEVLPFIKIIRSSFDDLLVQNKTTACYFLFGKISQTINAILLLAKKGFHYEIMELIRSNQEAVDLIHLFLEDKDNSSLKKWFKGEIVGNRLSRDSAKKFLNPKEVTETDEEVPIDTMMAGVYGVLSKYNHVSYMALLDSYNVFEQDFDFNQNAGSHYVMVSSIPYVKNSLSGIIIALKHFYQISGDKKAYSELTKILARHYPEVHDGKKLLGRVQEFIKKFKASS